MSDTLPTKFDAELRHRFLQVYGLCGQVQKSCQAIGISAQTVRKLAKSDPAFSDAMDEAKEVWKEHVEREVVRRAIDGWEEPVYQKGEEVGAIRKFDSGLLAMLIKKLDPSYKENHQIDISIGGGLLATPAVETADEWEKRNKVDADFEEVAPEEETE